jgi:CheY-like chemotaxis protein
MEQTRGRQSAQQTILVVDDEPAVLILVSTLLIRDDYKVLTATDGEAALQRSQDYRGEIHVLLSDFEMPGMTGTDLAIQIISQRPQIKVVLMSGCLEGRLVLNEGWHFLAKPFLPSELRASVVGHIG